MKRNELSLHRKEQMAASLKKLMTRKNLGRITIQELADDCGINRYTFYYHFQDIYDLLSWTFRQDFEKLFADRSRCPTLEVWIQNLIRYLKENAAVCKSALSSMGGDSFRRICVEDISGMMHDRDVYKRQMWKGSTSMSPTVNFTSGSTGWRSSSGYSPSPLIFFISCKVPFVP